MTQFTLMGVMIDALPLEKGGDKEDVAKVRFVSGCSSVIFTIILKDQLLLYLLLLNHIFVGWPLRCNLL